MGIFHLKWTIVPLWSLSILVLLSEANKRICWKTVCQFFICILCQNDFYSPITLVWHLISLKNWLCSKTQVFHSVYGFRCREKTTDYQWLYIWPKQWIWKSDDLEMHSVSRNRVRLWIFYSASLIQCIRWIY